MDEWKPEPKVAAAAIALLAVWLLQTLTGIDVPPGVEGAIAVLVAYLVPSTARQPLGDD